MEKKVLFISVVFLAFIILVGGPLEATGEIFQGLSVGVKQDAEGGFNNADLNDTYWLRNLSFLDAGTNTPTALVHYGALAFDGNGGWTAALTHFNSDGSTDANPGNGIYSVASDGSFTLTVAATPPEPDKILRGHISRDLDSQFIVLSQGQFSSEEIHQGIFTAVRAPDSPFSPSDLNGTWYFRDLELRNLEEDYRNASACKGPIQISNSNWTIDLNCIESDGTTHTDKASGTYMLSGNDFIFFMTGDTGTAFSANLSRDKSILIFTSGDSSRGRIKIGKGVALRTAPKSFTNADLAGTYFVHEAYFESFESDGREAVTDTATVTFDGNGQWAGTAQYFSSDGESGSDAINGSYSVAPDGSFRLIETSDTPNWTFRGDISGDGNTIIMGDRQNNANGGYHTVSGLWLKAVLQVPDHPVTLVWKQVGIDTTPSGAEVISGYFYADPKDFDYGSQYNPEVFVKIYIAPNGWCNIAFNHVTVDDVTVSSAHNFAGVPDQSGSVTLEGRLDEHPYHGVGLQSLQGIVWHGN